MTTDSREWMTVPRAELAQLQDDLSCVSGDRIDKPHLKAVRERLERILAAPPPPTTGDGGLREALADAREMIRYVTGYGTLPEDYRGRIARIDAALATTGEQACSAAKGEAVYLVPADAVSESGLQLYTRHEGAPPPMCDFERLYSKSDFEDVDAVGNRMRRDGLQVIDTYATGYADGRSVPSPILAAARAVVSPLPFTGDKAFDEKTHFLRKLLDEATNPEPTHPATPKEPLSGGCVAEDADLALLRGLAADFQDSTSVTYCDSYPGKLKDDAHALRRIIAAITAAGTVTAGAAKAGEPTFTLEQLRNMGPDQCRELGIVWPEPARVGGEAVTAEQRLAEAGVFKGHHGLRGLADAGSFWERQPYSTRLYYGDGITEYLHRGVLRAAVELLDAAAKGLTDYGSA